MPLAVLWKVTSGISTSVFSNTAVKVASLVTSLGTNVASSDTILPSAFFQPMNLYPSSAVAVAPLNSASLALISTSSFSTETLPPSVAL